MDVRPIRAVASGESSRRLPRCAAPDLRLRSSTEMPMDRQPAHGSHDFDRGIPSTRRGTGRQSRSLREERSRQGLFCGGRRQRRPRRSVSTMTADPDRRDVATDANKSTDTRTADLVNGAALACPLVRSRRERSLRGVEDFVESQRAPRIGSASSAHPRGAGSASGALLAVSVHTTCDGSVGQIRRPEPTPDTQHQVVPA